MWSSIPKRLRILKDLLDDMIRCERTLFEKAIGTRIYGPDIHSLNLVQNMEKTTRTTEIKHGVWISIYRITVILFCCHYMKFPTSIDACIWNEGQKKVYLIEVIKAGP